MLEARCIQLVPTPESTACITCGARYIPGREFIGFDNNSGDGADVPSGLIETAHDSPGHVAYRARDPYGGTATVVVRKDQQCSDCVKRAAELLGYNDTAPYVAEVAEKSERIAELEAELEESDRQRIEAEAALRDTAVYQRLLAPGATAATEKPAAPKRARSKA